MTAFGYPSPFYRDPREEDEDLKNRAASALMQSVAAQNQPQVGDAIRGLVSRGAPERLDQDMQLDMSPEERVFDEMPPGLQSGTQETAQEASAPSVESAELPPLDAIRGLTSRSQRQPQNPVARQESDVRSATEPPKQDSDEPGIDPIAVVVDLVTNGGRGIGNIMRTAEGQRQQWQARKDKLAAQSVDDELKRSQIDTANRNADLRAQELEMQLHPERQQLSPWQQEQLAVGREERKAAAERALADDQRADRALDLQDAERVYQRGQDAKQLGLQQAQLAETRRAHDLSASESRQAHADAAAARQLAFDERNRDQARIEGEKMDKEKRAFQEHYGKSAEAPLKAATTLKVIDDIMSRYENKKGGVPGLSRTENIVPRFVQGFYHSENDPRDMDSESMQNALGTLQQLLVHAESGAAFSNRELLMKAVRTASDPGSSSSQRKEALSQLRSGIYGELRAKGTANMGAAREVARNQGLDVNVVLPETNEERAGRRRKAFGGLGGGSSSGESNWRGAF